MVAFEPSVWAARPPAVAATCAAVSHLHFFASQQKMQLSATRITFRLQVIRVEVVVVMQEHLGGQQRDNGFLVQLLRGDAFENVGHVRVQDAGLVDPLFFRALSAPALQQRVDLLGESLAQGRLRSLDESQPIGLAL